MNFILTCYKNVNTLKKTHKVKRRDMDYSDKIKIVNLRTGKPSHDSCRVIVRCDRSSILGNPFHLKNEGERRSVVYAHKQLLNKIRLNPALAAPLSLDYWLSQGFVVAPKFKPPACNLVIKELNRLENLLRQGKNISLECWCYPKQCHCDNYKSYLVWRLGLQ